MRPSSYSIEVAAFFYTGVSNSLRSEGKKQILYMIVREFHGGQMAG